MSEFELISLPNEDAEQAQTWGLAFRAWLGSLRSPNTRRVYESNWRLFLKSVQKLPWQIGKSDVIRWVNQMDEDGLSDCTTQQRVSAVSSFYDFVCKDYTIVANGREVPLYDINPAAGKSVRKPINPYGKAIHLRADEIRRLLDVIRRDNPQGLRDYALLLAYLLTGRRNSEVRNLKWGDLRQDGETTWYRWSGKGATDELYELPAPVWEAIRAYLAAAGRLESIQPGEYIFTALTDRASRLPNVKHFEPTANPLSMREVGRLLKRYCRAAGLDPRAVHVHTLRHTAAMLRKAAGDGIEQIREFLAHRDLGTTEIYLHRLAGRKDASWRKVGDMLGIQPGL